jgi:hypothetical protein
MNLSGGSKIKFIIQSHADKTFAFSDTEKRTISKTHNVKSSTNRQAWKLDIDSVGEAVSFIAASVANSAPSKIAGIDSRTPDPFGG